MKFLIPSLILATFSSASASFFVKEVPWPHRAQELKICFGSPSSGYLTKEVSNTSTEVFPTDKMQLITQTIAAEFAPLKTGISFKFVGQCSEHLDQEIDAIINWKMDSLFQGEGIGGFTYFSKDYRFKSGITFTHYGEKKGAGNFTAKEKFISSIIHEFGHLAGLGHEHLLLEALIDKNCDLLPKIFKKPGELYGRNNIDKTEEVISKYDPFSMMNYCWNNYIDEMGLSNKLHLSNEDMSALKARYPQKMTSSLFNSGDINAR